MRSEGDGATYTRPTRSPDPASLEQANTQAREAADSNQRQSDLAAWMRAVGTARYTPAEAPPPTPSQSDEVRNRQMRSRVESAYKAQAAEADQAASDEARIRASSPQYSPRDQAAARVDYLV